MGARSKIIASIGTLLLLAWLILFGVSSLLIRPQLAKIENNYIDQNTSRAIDALKLDIENLSTSCTDWGSWDETYNYVKKINPGFIAGNMQDSAIQNLQLNYVAIVDKAGNVIYTKGVSRADSTPMNVPADLLALFKTGGQFMARDDQSSHQGLLALDSGPVAFASVPILTSDGTGPFVGTLVFAQAIDDYELNKLSTQTELPIKIYKLASSGLPADITAVKPDLSDNDNTAVVITNKTATGYQLLQDASGNASIVIRVEVARDLSYQAAKSLNYYLMVAVVITLLLSLINGNTVKMLLGKQKTIELKDEFFSVASHDLRTPLTAIKGNSQLAKQMYAENNPGLGEMLDDIHSSSERLIRIVTNFLDAARLEQGKLPLKFEAFDIQAVVDEVVDELHGLAVEKSMYIKADLPKHHNTVYADKDRLKQVIYNLVGNAIKYTDEGGITISSKSDEKKLTISIVDTGRGISEEGKKLLFNRFRQTKGEDASHGSGLGLYIAKMLLQNMGGSVWLDSSIEDRGTTICFNVPIATTAQQEKTEPTDHS
jgi:signal transduction histidine kinase